MIIYHYTSRASTSGILQDGAIRPVSCLCPDPNRRWTDIGFQAIPKVVWLTSMSALNDQHNCGVHEHKRGVRLTLDLPLNSLEDWNSFANRNRIPRSYTRHLDYDSGYTAKSWFVICRPIVVREITEIMDLETGQVISKLKAVDQWKRSYFCSINDDRISLSLFAGQEVRIRGIVGDRSGSKVVLNNLYLLGVDNDLIGLPIPIGDHLWVRRNKVWNRAEPLIKGDQLTLCGMATCYDDDFGNPVRGSLDPITRIVEANRKLKLGVN